MGGKEQYLGNEGGSGGGGVLPVRGELVGALVVARKAVDARLNQNEVELGVLVLAVPLQMLANNDGLLDEMIHILGDRGSQAVGLEDANQLGACDALEATNSVRVTEDNTDLRRGQALLSELADLLADLLARFLQPRRSAAAVGEGRSRNALSLKERKKRKEKKRKEKKRKE